MIVSMIVAMANDRIIGKNNQMPWHLPADFAWFKHCTMGKPIIMGRKTYESIGRPLPGRQNIIISRDLAYAVSGATVVSSVNEAFKAAANADEVMIIGGGSIYQSCLPFAQRLYVTHIHTQVDEGDTQFPELTQDWQTIHNEAYAADEKNAYDMDFTILEKVSA